MADPVLKWAGGKRQLLDELLPRFPQEFDSYHEPFFGGGAIFFDIRPDNGTINDTNKRLMNFYRHVRDHPDQLQQKLRTFNGPHEKPDPELPYSDEESYYYQQRERFNKRPRNQDFDPLTEAALFLYLNRTCFNGLFRENSDGEFNVPAGSYSNPDWYRKREIRQASRALENTTTYATDFEYILDEASENDLVYFDPPYKPVSQDAYFTEYSADGFEKEDQERLLDIAKMLNEQDVYVILSNSGVTYDLYDDAGFDVNVVGARRSINSDGDNRDEVDEIIATNIPHDQQRAKQQSNLIDF